jgi:hypothetical protein
MTSAPQMPNDASVKGPLRATAVAACLLVSGCGGGGGGNGGGQGPLPPQPEPPIAASAFVPTSDFSTGSYSMVNLRARSVRVDLPLAPGIAESDSGAVYFDQSVFILNRFGFDSVSVLALDDLTTAVSQFSTGNGSNPQDMVFVSGERAYISLLGSNELLVVDPGAASGSEIRDRIDLTPLLDPLDTDGLVEASAMERIGPYVYVALQNLDNFAAARPGVLAVVDTRTNTLVDVTPDEEGIQGIVLSLRNPVAMKWVPEAGRLIVASAGAFGADDGGLETVDPFKLISEGVLSSEAELGGGDVGGLADAGGRKLYVIAGGFEANDVRVVDLSIDPGTGRVSATAPRGLGLSLPFIPGLAVDGGGQLVVPDRSLTAPGLRLFDTERDRELTTAAIDVGLPPGAPIVVPPTPPRVFVPTTDFTTGSYSTLNPISRLVSRDLPSASGISESDNAAAYHNNRVYLLNRFGFDNISVLDVDDLTTALRQFSTGNGSNPQGMAFVSDRQAYVSLLGSNELLVVDPGAPPGREVTGQIDLSPLLDPADSDGLVEAADVVRVGRHLFVTLQSLDNFVALRPGVLAVVDTATDTLVDVDPEQAGLQGIPLEGLNPTALHWAPELGRLLVSQAGAFGVADGGVESVDPFRLLSEGLLISEADLGGGDVGDLVSVAGQKVYVVAGGFEANDVRVFDVFLDTASGEPAAANPRSLGLDLPFAPGLAVDGGGRLFVPDRTLTAPGIRIFDTATDEELTSKPLDVGLPPGAPVVLYP